MAWHPADPSLIRNIPENLFFVLPQFIDSIVKSVDNGKLIKPSEGKANPIRGEALKSHMLQKRNTNVEQWAFNT